MITRAQYVYFVSRALNGMAAIVEDLGDDLANRRLPLPGANSPYAVVNHCLGAVDYWAGEVVGGRPAHRDRDAEFTASGPVGPLLDRLRSTLGQLTKTAQEAPVRAQPHTRTTLAFPGLEGGFDQGGALFHLYTDLVQHHGQLEITRDALIAEHSTAATH